MTGVLQIVQAGPLMTVQDAGRTGRIAVGLSPGGAMDRLALREGAALLGLPRAGAAIEMAGLGGRFTSTVPLRFALTGAEMSARIDEAPCRWNASHLLQPGQTLTIGGARAGSYGYLTPAAGIAEPPLLGSVAAHLSVGLGRPLRAGDDLTLGADPHPQGRQMALARDDRLSGGTLRLMPGPQTDWFDQATRDRLARSAFRRSPRANRTGLPLVHDGDGFAARTATSPVSDFIVAGDLQITGDGTPYLMLAECQTIGGYPRIGTVIAADLPRAAQATPTDTLRFTWITPEEAAAAVLTEAQRRADMARRLQPLIRDPAHMPDLLSYNLIGGVTAGRDTEQAP